MLKLGMTSRYDPWEPPLDPQYIRGVPMVWCQSYRVYSSSVPLPASLSTISLRSARQARLTILPARGPPAMWTIMLTVSGGRCTSVCEPDTSPSNISS